MLMLVLIYKFSGEQWCCRTESELIRLGNIAIYDTSLSVALCLYVNTKGLFSSEIVICRISPFGLVSELCGICRLSEGKREY